MSTATTIETITWHDFKRVELRVGTVVAVEQFPEAKRPAYKLTIDFGEFGIKRSSAQITVHYTAEQLVGKQVVAVINFPKKQVANFMSEVLVTGFADASGAIVLVQPERTVPNGAKLI